MRRTVALLASLVLAVALSAGSYVDGDPSKAQAAPGRPNIILILTDDLDSESIKHMPNLKRYLINQGTSFENAFVTTPLCCPSRATILRGQYAHNHRVLTNGPPLGGFKKFRSKGHEKSTIATWMHRDGYRTVLIGKYLNGTPQGYTPPGWDQVHSGGFEAAGAYHTDWYANRADAFIGGMSGERQPFFMYLATKAPHQPATPAPRHADAFPNAQAPRPPSFNEADVSDKPRWIRQKPLLSSEKINGIDRLYRKRLQSMLAVDEMVSQLVRRLRAIGELEETYIFFTSDNGFSMGEHRRPSAKGAAYEESIRVPLIVRGPGVPEGKAREHMVLNNDLAPTFGQLSRSDPPAFVDGRSLGPLLNGAPPPPSSWRSAFLVEGHAGGKSSHPTYRAVRTTDYLWVEYVTGERELYDMDEDPYQLSSIDGSAPVGLKDDLSARLDRLRVCAREKCRNAEGF